MSGCLVIMSDKINLVIDVCVGISAGGDGATDIVSVGCSDFLLEVLDDKKFKYVVTPEIRDEWHDNVLSKFAISWKSKMYFRDRVTFIQNCRNI